MAFEHLFIELRRIKRAGRLAGAGCIAERLAGIEYGLRYGAVDQAGIEVPQPIVAGQPLPQRPLARRRRSIDGDDHDSSAPRERIIGTKLGKLVTMNEESSMPTGFALASPIIRNAIAMR